MIIHPNNAKIITQIFKPKELSSAVCFLFFTAKKYPLLTMVNRYGR